MIRPSVIQLGAVDAEVIGDKKVAAALRGLDKLGIELPKAYVAHLKKMPALSFLAQVTTKGGSYPVTLLYGGSGRHGVLENYDNAERRNYIAIGRDDGGNQILLAWRGTKPGSVWFWDHETAKMVFLADSFATFVKCLIPQEDEEEVELLDYVAFSVSVPRSKADKVRTKIEAIGQRAEKLGIGEIGGTDDEENPPRWIWVFEVLKGTDKETLRKFIEGELKKDSAFSDARVSER